jgi:Skp family chaperone for outer membrane proteins
MKICRFAAFTACAMVALSLWVVPSGLGEEKEISVEQVFLEVLTRKKVLEQLRKEWPEYQDLSDDQLAREFYRKAKEDSAVKDRLEQMILEDRERDERRLRQAEERLEKDRQELMARWDVSAWESELDQVGRFHGFQCAEGVIVVLDTKEGHLWSYAVNHKLEYVGQIVPGEPIQWPH